MKNRPELRIEYKVNGKDFTYTHIYFDFQDDDWADDLVEILGDIAQAYKTAKIWHLEQEEKDFLDDNA